MKPSEACKQAGLKSLAELCDIVKVSERTIRDWFKSRPEVFAACILYGVEQKRQREERQTVVDDVTGAVFVIGEHSIEMEWYGQADAPPFQRVPKKKKQSEGVE